MLLSGCSEMPSRRTLLRILGLFRLVMSDRGTRRRTGNRMAAADLMPGQRADRRALRGPGRLLVAVARRMRDRNAEPG